MQAQPYHQSVSEVSSVHSNEIEEAVNHPFDSSPVFPPQEDSPLPAEVPIVHHSQATIQPTQRRPDSTPTQFSNRPLGEEPRPFRMGRTTPHMIPGRDNRGPMTDRKLFTLDQGDKQRASLGAVPTKPFSAELPRIQPARAKVVNASAVRPWFLLGGVLLLIAVAAFGLYLQLTAERFCDSSK